MPVAIALRGSDQLVDLRLRQMLRVRSSALGRRFGMTVRFTVSGVTSLRFDLLRIVRLPGLRLFA